MHQVCRLSHERAKMRDSIARLQIEADAAVHASLPEVAEQVRGVVVLVVHGVKVTQVPPELFRRNRGVVPSRPHCRGFARGRNGWTAHFADFPQLLLLLWLVEHAGVGLPRKTS